MIRHLLRTAALSGRLSPPMTTIASGSSKSALFRRPAWHQPVRKPTNRKPISPKQKLTAHVQKKAPSPLHPSDTLRFLSSTPRTASNSPSPFRLSTNKNPSSPPSSFSAEDGEGKEEYYSPYKPKRQWPPDMSKLSPKHQFRLERKYRRRAALKYARPKFIKAVTLAQWMVIAFVAIYAVLFMEWDTRETPFDGVCKKSFCFPSSLISQDISTDF